MDTDGDPRGIAVAGDVRVEWFADLPETQSGELRKFAWANMLAAEGAAITRYADGMRPHDKGFDAEAQLMQSQLASAPFDIYIAKTATMRGAPVLLIEGSKSLKMSDTVVSIHTGAGATRDRDGRLRLLGVWSYLNMNENVHGNVPLAVLERNGEACWVIGHTAEGGFAYRIARPGQIDPEQLTFGCDIK